MQCNVGKTDRLIRLVLGLVLLGIGIMSGSYWGAIGLVPIVTVLLNWCPAYSIFGISSCKD